MCPSCYRQNGVDAYMPPVLLARLLGAEDLSGGETPHMTGEALTKKHCCLSMWVRRGLRAIAKMSAGLEGCQPSSHTGPLVRPQGWHLLASLHAAHALLSGSAAQHCPPQIPPQNRRDVAHEGKQICECHNSCHVITHKCDTACQKSQSTLTIVKPQR